MQNSSTQSIKGSTTSGLDGPAAACQLTNRKARSNKHLDLPGQSLTHRAFCPDEADYANLIGAMDNDLDRPDTQGSETLQEQNLQSIQNKGSSSKPSTDTLR